MFSVYDRALRALGWNVETSSGNDPKAEDFHKFIRYPISKGYYPKKTVEKSESDRLFFRISKGAYSFCLRFYDPPGEIVELTLDDKPAHRTALEQLFRHILMCQGLLVLLDLGKSAQDLMGSWQLAIDGLMAYIRKQDDPNVAAHLLENNTLKLRTAVLFTKADLSPWFARHRQRDAAPWLQHTEGLRDLHDVIRRACPHVRFYFSSAVGWNRGEPNGRSIILPTPLHLPGHQQEADADAGKGHEVLQGDLIPDPAEAPAGTRLGNTCVPRPSLPLFTDPLKIVDAADEDLSLLPSPPPATRDGDPQQKQQPYPGVHSAPGRKRPTIDHHKYLAPWNIVEPLLWAALGDRADSLQ
jgi:hypothetical protein